MERIEDAFRVSEGAALSPTEAIHAVRLMLRGGGWCRLEDGDRFYIHVGPNYDVYIGADAPCDHSVELAKENGVFVVRDVPSPYLSED